MKTENIYVSGEEENVVEAVREAKLFADHERLSPKDSMRLQLLAEEMLGLLGGITRDDYSALFWIEGTGQRCELHLVGKTEMTAQRREELLASSKTGRNAAAVGIVGKIKDMISACVLNWNEAAEYMSEDPGMSFYSAGMDAGASGAGMMAWSLSGYRSFVEDKYVDLDKSSAFDIRGPWDELERSVIANLADDVRVSIRKDHVEIVVVRSNG